MKPISNLQFITNSNSENSIIEQIQYACEASCKWIQLRMKDMPEDEIVRLGKQARYICEKYNAVLIINDYPHLVKQIGANGVHLGKNDMSPTQARQLLGKEYIIGGTANNISDIKNLFQQAVDYIGLGPFKFTNTKKNLSPVLGLKYYSEIIKETKNEINIPIVAIGGIEIKDIADLLSTGIHGIAVSSLIANAKNIKETFCLLKKEIEHNSPA